MPAGSAADGVADTDTEYYNWLSIISFAADLKITKLNAANLQTCKLNVLNK